MAARLLAGTPSSNAPRERILEKGPAALSDAELLALVFGLRNGGLDLLGFGRALLSRHGSLRRLGAVQVKELCALPGIGPARAAALAAALEIGRRASATRFLRGERYTSSRQVVGHFRPRLRDLAQEAFFAVYLDSKNRKIEERLVSLGCLSASIVHPREVYAPGIACRAASLLVLHNHPSGDPAPSREDYTLTRRLSRAGALLGIRLLDHIVIGEAEHFSFADSGMLS